MDSMSVNNGNLDVYGDLQGMIAERFRVIDDGGNEEEAGQSKTGYVFEVCKSYLRQHKKEIFVGLAFILVLLHMVYSGFLYIYGMYHLNTGVFPNNAFYYLFAVIVPFFIWCISSLYDFYNYHRRKIMLMNMCIIHACIMMAILMYIILSGVVMPVILRIPLSRDISPDMIFNLGRLVMIIVSLAPSLGMTMILIRGTKDVLTKKGILSYRLGKTIDLRSREEKRFAYDMNIVRNLDTGRKHVIKEKDRFIHSLANGTTGTGKTSSLFTTAITSDMDKIVENKDYQKAECKKLLEAGKIRLKEEMEDSDFNINAFEAVDKEGEKELKRLKYKCKVAGITAMAPNAGFSDQVYALAKARGLKVNRLDPTFGENGYLKPGFKGFNPLYIPEGLDTVSFLIEAARKAILVADVAQAIYDSQGQSDVYFASLNRNISTVITMLLEFTYQDVHGNKQPTLDDVQQIINYFPNVMPYRSVLVEKYALRDENGAKIYNAGGNPKMSLPVFQVILDVIDNELLGDGAEKMNDQCRGLRIIYNTILNNLNIRNILCCEDSIDIEKSIECGEITLVNYALELSSAGTAFGLFFMLSYINAALRRGGTEDTRIPNFCYVDEFPVVLHPSMDQCFSLFRQYRIAMFVAIQSLSQMDKSPSTAFMKPVLQGNCAHHFVFGRVAPEEMRMYEEMAGKEFHITEQKGTSQTSLTTANPSISFNERQQLTLENRIEGGDIRNLQFQEVCVVTVDNGSPVDLFFGKVSFLSNYKRIKKKLSHYDWEKYYDELTEKKMVESEGEEAMNKTLADFAVNTSSDVYKEKSKKMEGSVKPAFFSQISSSNAGCDEQEAEKVEDNIEEVQEDEDCLLL